MTAGRAVGQCGLGLVLRSSAHLISLRPARQHHTVAPSKPILEGFIDLINTSAPLGAGAQLVWLMKTNPSSREDEASTHDVLLPSSEGNALSLACLTLSITEDPPHTHTLYM